MDAVAETSPRYWGTSNGKRGKFPAEQLDNPPTGDLSAPRVRGVVNGRRGMFTQAQLDAEKVRLGKS